MLPKPLHQIDRADIDALVTRQITEGTSLEFKREPITPNDEVARDVAAMANGGGGDIIVGVRESNGIATEVTPFANGENEANRMVSIALMGVSPRLSMGTRVISGNGGDLVVARIGRARIPAMVHLGNRTDFWERRDRQRVRMTHVEIIRRVREGLSESERRADFIRNRIEHFKAQSGGLGIFISTTPDALSESEIISIRDPGVQRIMREPSRIRDTLVIEGTPQPTLDGLRSTRREIPGYRFELHRSGHIELQFPNAAEYVTATRDTTIWDDRGREIVAEVVLPGARRAETLIRTTLAGGMIARTVMELVARAKRVYESTGTFEPIVVTFAIVGAGGTLLPGRILPREEGTVVEEPGTPWVEGVLVVQAPGFPEEPEGVIAKRLCDLVWQAYGRWGCPAIDDQGRLV